MKVKIKTKDIEVSMPVPVSMAGFVTKLLPEKVFTQMQAHTPPPYSSLVTKEYISMILNECQDILTENKGLEIIHVEGEHGTFVSVKL